MFNPLEFDTQQYLRDSGFYNPIDKVLNCGCDWSDRKKLQIGFGLALGLTILFAYTSIYTYKKPEVTNLAEKQSSLLERTIQECTTYNQAPLKEREADLNYAQNIIKGRNLYKN